MKHLLKGFKSISIAALALSFFLVFSLNSCAPSNTNENAEDTEMTEEDTMESEAAEEHPEGGEHPEHPEGAEHPEHPSDEGEASDSTDTDSETIEE